MTDQSIDAMTPEERRKHLAKILGAKAAKVTQSPLSFGQRALWFLQELDDSSAAYNVPFAVRLRSPVDVAALRRACQRLVDRHPMLRSTFAAPDGIPVQYVHPKAEVFFCEVDASAWCWSEVQARAAEEAHRPFRIQSGPLFRVHLYTLSPVEHLLLLNGHHIVLDFWSLLIVVDELRALYRADRSGAPARLPPLRAQYSDHVRAQAELLESAEGERLWSYWKEKLGGNLPVLGLPADHRRPSVQTFRGASVAIRIDEETTARLREVGKLLGTTLNTTLLAGFQILLHRLAGQDDVLVGIPTADRDRADLAEVVGYFVNPVVLRSDLSGDPTFLELLRRVRDTSLEGLAHKAFPFAKLVERLQPSRDAAHSPLFQAMFVLQKAHRGEGVANLIFGQEGTRVDMGGLDGESVLLEVRSAQFDVEMMLVEMDGALSGRLIYNSDLFDPSTAQRFASHYQTLLEAIGKSPEQAVSRLALLTDRESGAAIVTARGRCEEAVGDSCFHLAFEQQVLRTPEAVAATDGARRLSYRELNCRANVVAHHLRRLGVGPDSLVAINLDRSLDMLAAVLGVFKAGAAYVPLDPGYPRQRLEYIVADAEASVLVTDTEHLDGIPESHAQIMCLDEALWTQSDEAGKPVAQGAPSSLAYVIYTSGSTGTPKGVMVEHGGMMNHLRAKIADLELGADVVLAQTASQCFDISVWQFLAPLLLGGRVEIVEDARARDPGRLLDCLQERQVTVAEVVPAMLRAMLDELGTRAGAPVLSQLRWLLVTGEAFPSDICRAWMAAYPSVKLVNAYGPTECSDDVTHHLVRQAPSQEVAHVPIGRPILNTQVYVLDRHRVPVPVGVIGELYVGGAGVGRGYWRDPARTEAAFVPDPFSGRPGARLFRTGDLGRVLPDGSIDFVGRIDHQVKVRGLRIELGEIEAALRAQTAISNAAVVVRQGQRSAARQLVAYIVPKGSGPIEEAQVRAALRAKLPEYMVPSRLVQLSELPVTANGKIDRAALPEPESCASTERRQVPRSPTERILKDIWSEVLGVEELSIDDNFFDLGGHSLTATQVVSRIRKRLEIELPVRTIFEVPTIAGLAERIEASAKTVTANVAIVRVPRDAELPLSYAQQRLWFLAQLDPNSAAYNIPAVVRLEGDLSVAALERAIGIIVDRHEALRTSYETVQGRAMQRIHAESGFVLRSLDLRAADQPAREQSVRLAIADEAERPVDLNSAPMVRATLVRETERAHLLLLTFHHIACDGWSLGVFVRELRECYAACVRSECPALPELPIQYADYAVWQRSWLADGRLERELKFWKDELAGVRALDLPTDRPRGARRTLRGAVHRHVLGGADRVKELCKQEGVTPFMVLLSAFFVLLHRLTESDDLVVGTPIANRERVEVESLIGFFVNTLVMRGDLSGNPTFRQLLDRVRRRSLDAFAHQDLPFERLVEEVQVERSLSRAPLVDVLFAVQNAQPTELDLPGLTLSLLPPHRSTAKFDLTLEVDQSAAGLLATWEYATDLFEEQTIQGWSRCYDNLVASIVADPDRPIAELSIVTDSERRHLIELGRARMPDTSAGMTLHQMFEAQADRSPEAIAVTCDGASISYRELEARANRVANRLIGMGVGPNALVGLCVERSLDLVVGIVGILKAGAAYVPIDPTCPPDRIGLILADANVAALVAHQTLVGQLPGVAPRMLLLDAEAAALAKESDCRPHGNASSGGVAYVIYTSGSTGRPKGVLVSHASAVRLFTATDAEFGFGDRDVWSMFHSAGFDVSVFELWGALLFGGRLVVVPYFVARSPDSFYDLVVDEGVTVLSQTPTAFKQFQRVDEGRDPNQLSVRYIIFAGEALDFPSLASWFARHGDEKPTLVNCYGITETTVHTTIRRLKAEDASAGKGSRIGQAIPDLALHVLDKAMQPCPIGVPGEIYVGGPGVACGYLNRAELTEERFVKDPFADEPGARLYRSGDIARRTVDGDIEYLGRRDAQVKIRGYRIEVGEIEAVLRLHSAVREAVVHLVDVAGERSLVAYVVARDGIISNDDLRRHLQTKLPSHMIPSAFTWLDALPMNANGKIDRTALPAPDRTRANDNTPWAAPSTQFEKTLSRIWTDVLQVERVGVDDPFFHLGGTSISMVQVQSKIKEATGRSVSIVDLFQYPTIRSLAEHLTRQDNDPENLENSRNRGQDRRQAIRQRRESRAR